MVPNKLEFKVHANQHCYTNSSIQNICLKIGRIPSSKDSLTGPHSEVEERISVQFSELTKGAFRGFFLSGSCVPRLGFSFFTYMLLCRPSAYAQNVNAAPLDGGVKPFPSDSWLTSREIVVSACVLLFGLAMTIIASRMLSRSRVPVDDVIRLFALVIIVTGVLFLVAAGYSATDIAPSMGLLGTIAGYILGRTSRGGAVEGRQNADAQSREAETETSTPPLVTRTSTGSHKTEHPAGSKEG